MLNQRSQTQKKPHFAWFFLENISRICKFIETEYRLMVTQGWGERRVV
jgi:hypothetical protein